MKKRYLVMHYGNCKEGEVFAVCDSLQEAEAYITKRKKLMLKEMGWVDDAFGIKEMETNG